MDTRDGVGGEWEMGRRKKGIKGKQSKTFNGHKMKRYLLMTMCTVIPLTGPTYSVFIHAEKIHFLCCEDKQ